MAGWELRSAVSLHKVLTIEPTNTIFSRSIPAKELHIHTQYERYEEK